MVEFVFEFENIVIILGRKSETTVSLKTEHFDSTDSVVISGVVPCSVVLR